MAAAVALHPYRQPAVGTAPLLTYAAGDVSPAATTERLTAEEAAIASQPADSIVQRLGIDTLHHLVHNIMPHGTLDSTFQTLPSLIATMQLAKTCKFFNLAFKGVKLAIDATRVDRMDRPDLDQSAGPTACGDADRNLYKQRFLLREIEGGVECNLSRPPEIDEPLGEFEHTLLIYRDLDATSAHLGAVTIALAARRRHGGNGGRLCLSLDLDDAVRLLSGHDTNNGFFHLENLEVRRITSKRFGVAENVEVHRGVYKELFTDRDRLNDAVTVELFSRRNKSVFGASGGFAPICFETSITTCRPFDCKFLCLRPADFKDVCKFLGYATETDFVARCRFGEDPDECYIRAEHTVDVQRRPPTPSLFANISQANAVADGKRRRVGKRTDETNYVDASLTEHVTPSGKLKRTHPLWQSIHANEIAYNQLTGGNYVDSRICHYSDEEEE